MKDLFYSKNDNVLFWVANYTVDNNTRNVMEKINSLIKNARIFRKHCKCKVEEIKTFNVEQSSRYKYMRVFYIENPKIIPNDAFDITNDYWTMEKWLTK